MTETGQVRFPAFTAHCPEGVLEMKLTVAHCHTDSSGRMPPHVLAKVMEDAVKRQMEACGWGRETMETKNVALVVGWTSIQIRRLPHVGENLLVRVWPSRKKSAMYVHKYAFFTDAGEALASAAVLSLPMDRTSRKLTPAEGLTLPEIVIPGEADVPSLRKAFPDELPGQAVRTVCAHEIDENGHMNNTCYLQWAGELYDRDHCEQHEPRSIWIQYINELMEGQTVMLDYATEGQCLFVRGTANQTDSFLAVIQYESLANDRDCQQILHKRNTNKFLERSGKTE